MPVVMMLELESGVRVHRWRATLSAPDPKSALCTKYGRHCVCKLRPQGAILRRVRCYDNNSSTA
jgi:hypothetical protein